MANIKDIAAGLTYVKIMVDNQALEKGLQKSESLVKRFGDVCASIGSKMTATGVMLAAPFANAVRVFTQFDDQMRMTKAVTAATNDEFALLTQRARQIGRDTAFSASQAAAGMTALGRMGFSSKEIDSATPSVVDLALATGTDLAQAADIAANSLRMFKLQAGDMTKVADVLTATANGSAQTLVDLFEALKMAGPQAAVAKESIEDVSAAIGVMANVGIKGSLAGTALRRAYANMANGKIQEYLDQYNIKTVDATGNLRKMKDIIVDVAKAMQNMGTAEKMSFAEDVFDMRGSFVGLTLGGNVEGLLEFSRMLEQDISGKAKKTREEIEGGIGGGFRNLSSAWEDVNHALAGTINETLVPLLKILSQAANAVSQWITENAGLVRSLAIGTGVLLALGSALTVTGLGIGALSSATGNLRAVFAKIVSPITEYRKAAEMAVQNNLDLATSSKTVAGATYAQVQAEGAAIATAHAQQQVTAAQIAVANARTPAEHAAAKATMVGAAANLEQAKAAEQAAMANLHAVQAADAKAAADSKLTLAQKYEAQTAVAAAAAKTAAEKRLVVIQTERALAQRIAAHEVAIATGIDVAAAKENMQLARTNYNVAVSNYEVAKAEAARAAAMQAALSPQAAQTAGAQRMLSMLRLQPTAANMAMASFLALNNAQAGSAAAAKIAAASTSIYGAVCKATAAASGILTAALSRQGIAAAMAAVKNALATASTVAMGLAGKATAAASGILTAALSRQGIAAAMAAVKNALATAATTALGVAAKIATAGALGLTAALDVLVAHPVIAALAAIALLYHGIAKEAKEAAKETAAIVTATPNKVQSVNTDRQQFREAAAIRDDSDFARLRELSAVSQQAKLSAEQVSEAEQLLHRLGNRGFTNLPKLDALAGSLESISDAAKESFDTTKKQIARNDISSEYQDKLKELEARRKSYQALLQKSATWGLKGKKEVFFEQANNERERIQQLAQELADLNKAAKTADAGLADTKAQQKEATLAVSMTVNSDAQKRLAEISKKIADDKLSDIEREINGIRDLRTEYVTLLKTRLAFERNKPKPDNVAINELETMLAEADALFGGMESAAYENHYKGIYSDLDEASIKREDERRRNEKDARERASLEKLKQTSPEQYKVTLNTLLDDAYADLAKATSAYKSIFAEVTAGSSDQGKIITEQEKKRIDLQKELYDLAQGRIDSLREKLLDVEVNVDEITKTNVLQSSLAGFVTADVMAMLGGTGGPEEETAKNTRAMAENIAVMKDLIRNRRPAAFA